jgi:hypothetical protein
MESDLIIPSVGLYGEWTEEQRRNKEFPLCEIGEPGKECKEKAEFMDSHGKYGVWYCCIKHVRSSTSLKTVRGLSLRAQTLINIYKMGTRHT